MIFMIIGAAILFGQVLTINQVPQKIVHLAVQTGTGQVAPF